MAIPSCPFENVGTTLQSLAVEWLNEVGETAAAAWFEGEVADGTCIILQCYQQQLPRVLEVPIEA